MIAPDAVDAVLHELCRQANTDTPVRREPLHVWHLSAVERLHLPDGRSLVLKYATAPFTGEHHTLAAAATAGVPVPAVLAAHHADGLLGMLMTDLGRPVRAPTISDAAAVAVCVHRSPPPPDLPSYDQAGLAALPARCQAHLATLRAARRWPNAEDLFTYLSLLDRDAGRLAGGADLAPHGLCHGELHPTSVHIGASGRRVLDLAKAFHGPGLLDLATWWGTRQPPDPAAMRRLINTYVEAGGAPQALADRGGLTAEVWALGWHRLWAAHWFLHHAARGHLHPADDAHHTTVVRRQLAAAHLLLTSPDPTGGGTHHHNHARRGGGPAARRLTPATRTAPA